jgi:hypothetical protein
LQYCHPPKRKMASHLEVSKLNQFYPVTTNNLALLSCPVLSTAAGAKQPKKKSTFVLVNSCQFLSILVKPCQFLFILVHSRPFLPLSIIVGSCTLLVHSCPLHLSARFCSLSILVFSCPFLSTLVSSRSFLSMLPVHCILVHLRFRILYSVGRERLREFIGISCVY